MKRKLATLTALQDARWDKLFELSLGQMSDSRANSRAGADAAGREAWLGLCEEWPSLKQFDGCKAKGIQ